MAVSGRVRWVCAIKCRWVAMEWEILVVGECWEILRN